MPKRKKTKAVKKKKPSSLPEKRKATTDALSTAQVPLKKIKKNNSTKIAAISPTTSEGNKASGIFGVAGISPKKLERVTKEFNETFGGNSEMIYSPQLKNAEVTARKPTGTPTKMQTTTPRKQRLEVVSTRFYNNNNSIVFFIPETSGYDSDEEARKLKATPNVSIQDIIVPAIATLNTIKERKKMSRTSQNEVAGGSADDIFEKHLLDFVSQELAEASKVHAHLIAKAIGGDEKEPNRPNNLSVATSRTNINMFIPERRIVSGLRNGYFEEIHLEVSAKEIYLNGKPTKVAIEIDYKINDQLLIVFNGLSITKLPYALRDFMRAFIDDYMRNSNSKSHS